MIMKYNDNEIETLDTDNDSLVSKNDDTVVKTNDSNNNWENILIVNKNNNQMFGNTDKKMDMEIIRKIYGEPVNKNPLLEIPTPDMRLYFVGEIFFETVDELLQYYKFNNSSIHNFNIIDYYKELAGCCDVIKISNKNVTMLYTAKNQYGCLIYDNDLSIYRGEYTWNFKYGDIRKLYQPFKDRGIVFENDVYGKIDERNKCIDDYYKTHSLLDILIY